MATDTYARLGATIGVATASKPDDTLLPIQSNMKRCVMLDDGTVNYYLNPTNSFFKDTGAPANLSGSDGQVMVQIPKFYVSQSYNGNVMSWQISNLPSPNFVIHPAFMIDGTEHNYRYIGAFKGVINTSSNKLQSLPGLKPAMNYTFNQLKSGSTVYGSNSGIFDWYLYTAIQLLYLTEYSHCNSQLCVGNGWRHNRGSAYPNRYTGESLSSGNNSTGSQDTSSVMSYRGIQNLWGGGSEALGGVKQMQSGSYHPWGDTRTMYAMRIFTCNTRSLFNNDDNVTNYTDTGLIQFSGSRDIYNKYYPGPTLSFIPNQPFSFIGSLRKDSTWSLVDPVNGSLGVCDHQEWQSYTDDHAHCLSNYGGNVAGQYYAIGVFNTSNMSSGYQTSRLAR